MKKMLFDAVHLKAKGELKKCGVLYLLIVLGMQ